MHPGETTIGGVQRILDEGATYDTRAMGLTPISF